MRGGNVQACSPASPQPVDEDRLFIPKRAIMKTRRFFYGTFIGVCLAVFAMAGSIAGQRQSRPSPSIPTIWVAS